MRPSLAAVQARLGLHVDAPCDHDFRLVSGVIRGSARAANAHRGDPGTGLHVTYRCRICGALRYDPVSGLFAPD